MWRSLLLRGVVWSMIVGVLVLTVAASGVLPFGAAARDPSLIDWLGWFATRRSISLRALGTPTPPLDDPSLVLRGAGHFQTVCRGCHGTPGGAKPVPARQMLPQPPDLLHVRERYSADELFQIVKHGIRMTGMPGWPTQERDDEVWAMVALLRQLPALGPDGYRALVATDVDAPRADVPRLAQTLCARCHGVHGLGRGTGAFPKLAGQYARYLHLSLRAYALGTRHSGIMSAVADQLDDLQMEQLAVYYSTRPGLSAELAGPIVSVAAADNLPPFPLPVCESCHVRVGIANTAYPILGGQYPEYLALQLRLFAERRRGGTPYAHLMHPAADRIRSNDRDAIAGSISGQPR